METRKRAKKEEVAPKSTANSPLTHEEIVRISVRVALITTIEVLAVVKLVYSFIDWILNGK